MTEILCYIKFFRGLKGPEGGQGVVGSGLVVECDGWKCGCHSEEESHDLNLYGSPVKERKEAASLSLYEAMDWTDLRTKVALSVTELPSAKEVGVQSLIVSMIPASNL